MVCSEQPVTKYQKDKGAPHWLQTAIGGEPANQNRRGGGGEGPQFEIPGNPHQPGPQVECKLHYSGEKGPRETILLQDPEEDQPLCKISGVFLPLLSGEHLDVLHHGLVWALFSGRQGNSPEWSTQHKKSLDRLSGCDLCWRCLLPIKFCFSLKLGLQNTVYSQTVELQPSSGERFNYHGNQIWFKKLKYIDLFKSYYDFLNDIQNKN